MRPENEFLRLRYHAYEVPISFLIDPEENAAFLFDRVLPFTTNTTLWLKEKWYLKSSPVVFRPAPTSLTKGGLYFEYARRDVRKAWIDFNKNIPVNDFMFNNSMTYLSYNSTQMSTWTQPKRYDEIDRCLTLLVVLALIIVASALGAVGGSGDENKKTAPARERASVQAADASRSGRQGREKID